MGQLTAGARVAAAARAAAAVWQARTAQAARAAGLEVNAGHDLNLQNLSRFVQAAAPIAEVSIGHALIGDALEMGLAPAVRAYLAALAPAASTAS